jgi:hypothetical protein
MRNTINSVVRIFNNSTTKKIKEVHCGDYDD